MLNEGNKIVSKCIDCLPLVYIACPQENGGARVIMAPITAEQEEQLNNEDYIIIKDQFEQSFVVTDNKCYAYGELDLSPKSDNIRKIAESNWFKNLYVNIIMLSEYDYETNTVTSDVEGGRWYETDNVETYLPFLHAKIGKPERVVIFRDDLDTLGFKKKRKTSANKVSNKYKSASKEYVRQYNRNKTIVKRKARVSTLQFKIKK